MTTMTTIFGWDASHYDKVPDGAKVVAEGFKFMTHKAGGDAADPELGSWWRALKPYRQDVLLGAYWVLKPGNGSSQAKSFIARLDSQCLGWRDGPFILQLDCEQWANNPDTVPGLSTIKTACSYLVGQLPKLRPIVYAPLWVYGNSLDGLGYPLWASSYVTGSGPASSLYPGNDSGRWKAYGGQTPAILQFTSSATIAGQTTCDANAYRGTLAELTALLAPGWKTEETDMNLTDKVGSKVYPGRTVEDFFGDFWKERDVLWGDQTGTKVAALPASSPLAKLLALPGKVDALSAELEDLRAALGGGAVSIPQAQLDLAVLNALKTLAGGQA
jgi:hypothetical protein